MNEAPKIQVTNTEEAIISRVEDETSISEVVVSNSGITGQIRKKSLPEVDLAGEVVFSDLVSSSLTNADEKCNITTGSIDLSDLVLKIFGGSTRNAEEVFFPTGKSSKPIERRKRIRRAAKHSPRTNRFKSLPTTVPICCSKRLIRSTRRSTELGCWMRRRR